MAKSWGLRAGVLVVASVLITSLFFLAWANNNRSPIVISTGGTTSGVAYGILVQGTGSVFKRPDLALISVGVDSSALSAKAAQADLAAKANQLVASAKKAGFADKDINTSGYSVSPMYAAPDYTHVTGYQASETLGLRWHNVDTVGVALDALVQNGGAGRVNISFTLSDPESAQTEAQVAAIADARTRAQALANAAGVKLGSVLRVSGLSTSGGFSPSVAAGASRDTQLPVGELEVSASVEVDFGIG